MLYQATRQFGDFVNGIEIPYGGYVETDCIKWVQRIGPFLRPLSPSEKPKGKVIFIKDTVEDTVIEDVIKDTVEDTVIEDVIKENAIKEPILEITEEAPVEETDVTEEAVVESTPLRRKIKPLHNN